MKTLSRTIEKLRDAIHSFAPFPLTPALSRRERENPPLARSNSNARLNFAAPPTLLPLPKGEGRGEGKAAFVPSSSIRLLKHFARPNFAALSLLFPRPLRGGEGQGEGAARILHTRAIVFTVGCLLVLLLSPSTAFAAEKKADAKKTPPRGPAWKKVLPQTPAGFTCTTNLVAAYPEHNVELVIYAPDKPGSYPCILDIHGGGWTARQIESDKPMMERLAARGFVTALVSYRLAQEAKYPAALTDCKSALRWLRANAAKFKIDPARLGCMGGSAGGHLSGLTGMTSGLKEFEGDGPHPEQSSAVQACIVMAATQDMVAANTGKASTNAITFFGAKCDDHPALYRAASPITHVRAGVPPVIFIEGERDTLKIGRAEMMAKLRALGIETAVHTLKDAPHPFWMSQPWCDETVEIAAVFFKKHLGGPK